MSTPRLQPWLCALLLTFFLLFAGSLRAEVDDSSGGDSNNNNTVQDSTTVNSSDAASAPATPATPSTPTRHKHHTSVSRHYLTDTPGRSDAGVFHVGFGVGGNLFIEPQSDPNTGLAEGAYYKDFGFGVGVFFDYDYSETAPNIPLELRGMIGYNYILSSVHMFTFDGVVRRVFRLAENATFGLGGGVSTAIWYRTVTDTS